MAVSRMELRGAEARGGGAEEKVFPGEEASAQARRWGRIEGRTGSGLKGPSKETVGQ